VNVGRTRKRITNLPATGAPGALLVEDNPRRVALGFKNVGTATVYVSDSQDDPGAQGFPIEPGDFFAPGTAPVAPQNELYAVADAACDLRIFEIVATDRGAP
jgi:hypothetical protein